MPATTSAVVSPAVVISEGLKLRRPKKTPRHRKPEDMSLEAWQRALRREFGREQAFKLENVGAHPIFSEFRVTNPQTRGAYSVTVRGRGAGDNHCTCPDFAINTLGTCKHIEFTLGRLEARRGGGAALDAGYQPEASEIYLRYDVERSVVFQAGAACPPALRRLAERHFDGQGRLKAEAFERFPAFLTAANRHGHPLRCREDVLTFVARVRDRAALRQRIDQMFPRGESSAALNKLLNVPLYPYQKHGALFAARAGRCLIADDMGLGKTIQAIAAAEILARAGGVERALIVCPTSLKHQWQQEIERFTGRPAEVVEGLLATRQAQYRKGDAFFKITNYDVLHRDLPDIQRWSADLVILDEAQRIKNWRTRAAQTVKKLDAPHAIVLTGTPLENRLEELHSIVEFVDRFRLGPAFRFLAEHQHADESGRVIGYKNLGRIAETLKPILIRRTKAQVLKELPQRLEKRLFVPMTEQQMEHHEENREAVARLVLKWRRHGFLSDGDQRRLRIALQMMRMACDSTYLVDHETDHGHKADEAMNILADVLEDKDAKVVVFSQWLRMHELLERRLEQRGWRHVLFHGGVPGPQRKHLVQQFKQDDDCRLFLSTDAGGVGLNLQHASVVMNMDLPWNPAVLEQRIGRVHRLGQQRPVRVIDFIAQGTIEHGMLSLLKFKKSMFAGVLDGGEEEVFLGGSRLKKFMESVERVSQDIPASAATEAESEADRREAESEAPTNGEAPPASTPRADAAWSELAGMAAAFLGKLGQAMQSPTGDAAQTGATPLNRLIARDERTGESYLRLPVPSEEVVGKIVDVLRMLTR